MYRNIENHSPCIEMPSELADRWLTALRSGEFKQCTGTLVRETQGGDVEGFCCLGVLQMITDGEVERLDSGTPCGVPSVDWLRQRGIRFSDQFDKEVVNPEFYVEHADHPTRSAPLYVSAATLNDNGSTFAEIADLIEPLIKKI